MKFLPPGSLLLPLHTFEELRRCIDRGWSKQMEASLKERFARPGPIRALDPSGTAAWISETYPYCTGQVVVRFHPCGWTAR